VTFSAIADGSIAMGMPLSKGAAAMADRSSLDGSLSSLQGMKSELFRPL